MEQVKINKDKFLKDYREQRARAFNIIKILKANSKIESVNYYLKTSIIIIDGEIKTKCEIEEYPISRYAKNITEEESTYFKDITLSNINEELKF